MFYRLSLVMILLMTSNAMAQSTGERAAELAAMAYEQLEAKHYPECIELLEQSYTAQPAPRTLVLMLRCQRAIPDCAGGRSTFERFQRICAQCKDASKAGSELNQLEESCTSQLTINTNPENAELLVDGQAVGRSPQTLSIKEGHHLIEAHLRNHVRSRTIDVPPGTKQRVLIKLSNLKPESTVSNTRLAAWTTLGVASASMIAGAIFATRYTDTKDQQDLALANKQPIRPFDRTIERDLLLTRTSFGVAAVTGIASVLLFTLGNATTPTVLRISPSEFVFSYRF